MLATSQIEQSYTLQVSGQPLSSRGVATLNREFPLCHIIAKRRRPKLLLGLRVARNLPCGSLQTKLKKSLVYISRLAETNWCNLPWCPMKYTKYRLPLLIAGSEVYLRFRVRWILRLLSQRRQNCSRQFLAMLANRGYLRRLHEIPRCQCLDVALRW